MKKVIMYIILLFVYIGCRKDVSHIQDNILNTEVEDSGAGVVNLTTNSTKPIKGIHIYGFATSGELKYHSYYPTAGHLASTPLFLDSGDYTFVTIINVGEIFTLPSISPLNSRSEELPRITLLYFLAWLEEKTLDHDNILTGIALVSIQDNKAVYINIEVQDGIEALRLNTLRLALTFPDIDTLTYTNNSQYPLSPIGYKLRLTAEIYQKGSDIRMHRIVDILNGNSFDLNLQAGDYNILLWLDYIPTQNHISQDHYYTTDDLSSIRYTEMPYIAGGRSRAAYMLMFDATVGSEDLTEMAIAPDMPFAKYQIIATDLERYRELIKLNNYPPLEELTVVIDYDSYLTNGFDVREDKPNSSSIGASYNSSIYESSATRAIIGGDFVFVDNISSAIVTITIIDGSGDKIAESRGVNIDYRRNYLTIISGDFLTSKTPSSGVVVDPDWDGENNFEF